MKINHDILVRYFLGRCSEVQKEAIHEWLESDEAHRKTFVCERIRFDASVVMSETGFLQQPSARAKNIVRTLLKVAAAILLLIGSNYLFNHYVYRPQPVADTIVQSLYVPPGNRAFLTLPDSSSVWLNSNSTIRYPDTFRGKTRIVELDGEAYFDVAKRKEQPFVVKTGKYQIEALGTTFNVEAYAGKADFSTALFTGKVRLSKEGDATAPLYLQPGEAATQVNDSLRISPIKTNPSRWREGLIVVDDYTFEEIMHIFEKYFDQQIIIGDSKVKTLRYRGKLRIADGVDHALRVLQNDVRFTYKRDEDSKIIHIY
ncbi:MAG: FecR domain-containing protein [Tannerella sp.]|jgi:ferric-dicitrate binding protein FerR (iron transport regulator)|nr:FecR domain-containing protein [Tannerella sp.]